MRSRRKAVVCRQKAAGVLFGESATSGCRSSHHFALCLNQLGVAGMAFHERANHLTR